MRTQREFFAALAKCRNGWTIDRVSRYFVIRHGRHCPITAVVDAETGVEYASPDYDTAANAIGLPRALANRIAKAADSRDAEPRLRKRILAALGLSE